MLKNCPFCGVMPSLHFYENRDGGEYFIICENCWIPLVETSSEEETIRLWNTRENYKCSDCKHYKRYRCENINIDVRFANENFYCSEFEKMELEK